MRTVTDFGISVAVFIILFIALIAEHEHNTRIIEEQHDTIYQQDSKIDDLTHQVYQCRQLVVNQVLECYQ
jgi:hypothetical protein